MTRVCVGPSDRFRTLVVSIDVAPDLWPAQGIFKPRVLSNIPLSITTVPLVEGPGSEKARRVHCPGTGGGAYAASSASVSLIGTSTPSSNRAASTSSPFIASMNFLKVPM
jgi:hypothetical protein